MNPYFSMNSEATDNKLQLMLELVSYKQRIESITEQYTGLFDHYSDTECDHLCARSLSLRLDLDRLDKMLAEIEHRAALEDIDFDEIFADGDPFIRDNDNNEDDIRTKHNGGA